MISHKVTQLDKRKIYEHLGTPLEVGELFKYLVSKQVESIDGLQSSLSQTHRAAEKNDTQDFSDLLQHNMLVR